VTTQGPMARAVAAALRAATDKQARDGGAVALAKRYATLIDDAAPLAKYREPLRALRRAVDECSDPRAGKELDKIEAALAAHSVASDLGPKLLDVLRQLGLTVAGRPAAKEGGAPGAAVASAIDEFTERRQRRSGERPT
jgi:hypothetical protein